jgi:hypothetical protein
MWKSWREMLRQILDDLFFVSSMVQACQFLSTRYRDQQFHHHHEDLGPESLNVLVGDN